LLVDLSLPLEWCESPLFLAALCAAPYPDRGHLSGPRALSALLAAPTPPPKRSES